MDWFRHYNRLSKSSTLALIARRLGIHRSILVHAWCYLLEEANAADERGSIEGLDIEKMAFDLDVDEETCGRILSELERKDMLSGPRIAKWERYQHESSTDRVRRHRERKRQAGNGAGEHETLPKRDVTLQKRDEALRNAPDSESDTDSESIPPSPLTSFGDLPPAGGDHASAPGGAPAESETGTGPPARPARKSRSANGSRLPPDWSPGEDGLRFAASLGLPPDRVRLEAERFRDYWAAQTGQRARKADWPATWRNWCRKAVDDLRRNRAPPGQPGSVLEAYHMASVLNPETEDDDPVEHGPLQALPH